MPFDSLSLWLFFSFWKLLGSFSLFQSSEISQRYALVCKSMFILLALGELYPSGTNTLLVLENFIYFISFLTFCPPFRINITIYLFLGDFLTFPLALIWDFNLLPHFYFHGLILILWISFLKNKFLFLFIVAMSSLSSILMLMIIFKKWLFFSS